MSSFDDVLASIQRLLVSEKVITERSGDKLKKALESDAGKGLLAEAAAAAATAAAEASNEPPLSQRRSTRKTGPCPAPDVPSPQQPEMISFSSLEDGEVIMKEGKNIVKCKVKNPAKNLNALKNLINLKNQQVVAVLSGKDKKGKSSSGKGKGRSSKKSSEQPSEEERGTEEDDEEIDMELDDDCEERLNASYNTQEEKDAATWLRLMNKITGDHSEPHGDAVRALSCAVDFATSARVKSKHQTLPSGVPVSRLDRQLRLCEVMYCQPKDIVGPLHEVQEPLITKLPIQDVIWSPAKEFIKALQHCANPGEGGTLFTAVPLLDVVAMRLPDDGVMVVPLACVGRDLAPTAPPNASCLFFAQRSIVARGGMILFSLSDQSEGTFRTLEESMGSLHPFGYHDVKNAALLADQCYKRLFSDPPAGMCPFFSNLGMPLLFKFAAEHLPANAKLYVQHMIVNHTAESRLAYLPRNFEVPLFLMTRVRGTSKGGSVDVVLVSNTDGDDHPSLLEAHFHNYDNLGDHFFHRKILCHEDDGGILSKRFEPVRHLLASKSTTIHEGKAANGTVMVVPVASFVELVLPPEAVVVVLAARDDSDGVWTPPQYDWANLPDVLSEADKYDDEEEEEENAPGVGRGVSSGSSVWPWYKQHVKLNPSSDADPALFFYYVETVAKIEAGVSSSGPQLISSCALPESCAQRPLDSLVAAPKASTLGQLFSPGESDFGKVSVYLEGGVEKSLSNVRKEVETVIETSAKQRNVSPSQYASDLAARLDGAKDSIRVTMWLTNLFSLEQLIKEAERTFKEEWTPFEHVWMQYLKEHGEVISELSSSPAYSDLQKLFEYYKAGQQQTNADVDQEQEESLLFAGFVQWMNNGSGRQKNGKPLRYRVTERFPEDDWSRTLEDGVDRGCGVLVVRETLLVETNRELLLALILPEAYTSAWAIDNAHDVLGMECRKSTKPGAMMSQVLNDLACQKSGRRTLLLTQFQNAATIAGAQMRVFRHMLEIFDCLPLSRFPVTLVGRLLDNHANWETTFKEMMPVYLGRTRNLPLYPVEMRRPLSCIRCGKHTMPREQSDFEGEENVFMCRLCQGHLCESCEAGCGTFGPLDDEFLAAFSPAPVDVLSVESSFQVWPGLCPPCFLTHKRYVLRDLHLVKQLLGERDTVQEQEVQACTSTPTPVMALSKMFGPAPDLTHTCIGCGHHTTRGHRCSTGSRFGAGRGACLSNTVLCSQCYKAILLQGSSHALLVCTPCEVLVKPPRNSHGQLLLPFGRERFSGLPSPTLGYRSQGDGGHITDEEFRRGPVPRIYVNQNRKWNGQLEDYSEADDAVFNSIVATVAAVKRGGQLPTKKAWQSMVEDVNVQLSCVAVWAGRKAYRHLQSRIQEATRVAKQHEKLTLFYQIFDVCKRSSCAMLGMSTSFNITLVPSAYFKVFMLYFTKLGEEELANTVFLEAGCGGGIVTLYAWLFGVRQITAYDVHFDTVQKAIESYKACFSSNWEAILPSSEQFDRFFLKRPVQISEDMATEDLFPSKDITIAHFVINMVPKHTEYLLEQVVFNERAASICYLTLSVNRGSFAVIPDLVHPEHILLKTPAWLDGHKTCCTLFVIEMSQASRDHIKRRFLELFPDRFKGNRERGAGNSDKGEDEGEEEEHTKEQHDAEEEQHDAEDQGGRQQQQSQVRGEQVADLVSGSSTDGNNTPEGVGQKSGGRSVNPSTTSDSKAASGNAEEEPDLTEAERAARLGPIPIPPVALYEPPPVIRKSKTPGNKEGLEPMAITSASSTADKEEPIGGSNKSGSKDGEQPTSSVQGSSGDDKQEQPTDPSSQSKSKRRDLSTADDSKRRKKHKATGEEEPPASNLPQATTSGSSSADTEEPAGGSNKSGGKDVEQPTSSVQGSSGDDEQELSTNPSSQSEKKKRGGLAAGDDSNHSKKARVSGASEKPSARNLPQATTAGSSTADAEEPAGVSSESGGKGGEQPTSSVQGSSQGEKKKKGGQAIGEGSDLSKMPEESDKKEETAHGSKKRALSKGDRLKRRIAN